MGTIAAMIRDGASDDAIAKYLLWAEDEIMGHSPGASETSPRLVRTVSEIRRLGPIP
jgi:hypothetical protein